MRLKNLAAAAGAATLLVGLTAAPAAAGTGPSQWCTDGVGYIGTGLTTPVTVSFEVYESPTNTNHQLVILCYSTSATTTPNSIIGGAIVLDVWTDTGTAHPGGYVALTCAGDSGVSVGPLTCHVPNSANVTPFDASAYLAGSTCLVALNNWCYYYIPGVVVDTDTMGYPLLSLTVAGVNVPVYQPAQCLNLLVQLNC